MLATLLAFVTFAVSFLARPFGSLLLGGQNAAMVMNFGIQVLGWHLGAMAVIALVALVFSAKARTWTSSNSNPERTQLKPESAVKLQAGLSRFCYSAGFTTVSCILNGVTPRTLCGLPEVMTID